MPRWDFFCPQCKTTKEYVGTFEETANVVCETCGTPLERLPALGSFVIKGYNAKNGYST